MSDDNFSLLEGSSTRMQLTGEVTILMLKGAGYAAVFCLVIWGLLAGMIWVGSLLPAESKEAIDPSPWSALEVVTPEVIT